MSVYAYCHSRLAGPEGESDIVRQKREVFSWIIYQGLELTQYFIDQHAGNDCAFSNRPQGARLAYLVSKRDVIVVESPDKIAVNDDCRARLLWRMDAAGVALRFAFDIPSVEPEVPSTLPSQATDCACASSYSPDSFSHLCGRRFADNSDGALSRIRGQLMGKDPGISAFLRRLKREDYSTDAMIAQVKKKYGVDINMDDIISEIGNKGVLFR